MARIFYIPGPMPVRHVRRLRASLVLGLLAGLGQAAVTPSIEALCPAPAAAMPDRCCGDEAPPRCPSCPSESRSSCPAPLRGRTLASPEALPPGEPAPVPHDARSGVSTTNGSETAPAAPARSSAEARRAAVAGASPPVRLLACTFRN